MKPKPPHAVVRLPPLDATSALSLINVLDAIIAAVWRAHSYAIIDLQSDLDTGPPRTPASPASDDDGLF